KLLPAMCADAGLGAPLVETILSLLDDQPERRPTLKQLADAIEQDQDAPGRRDAPVLSVRLESSGVSAFAGSEMTWLDTLIRSTERGITESAVPARSDRLFPADPRLFETNPLSVAYGAAGAARALAISGMEVSPKVLSWILSRNITADRYPP